MFHAAIIYLILYCARIGILSERIFLEVICQSDGSFPVRCDWYAIAL